MSGWLRISFPEQGRNQSTRQPAAIARWFQIKYTRPKFFVVVISTFHFNNDLGCLQEFIYRDLVFSRIWTWRRSWERRWTLILVDGRPYWEDPDLILGDGQPCWVDHDQHFFCPIPPVCHLSSLGDIETLSYCDTSPNVGLWPLRAFYPWPQDTFCINWFHPSSSGVLSISTLLLNTIR